MKNFASENFGTESHSEELDFIFNDESEDINDAVFENRDLVYDCKTYFRFFRKKIAKYFNERIHKNYTSIIYVTLDSHNLDFQMEYIDKIRKQYPENVIKILTPIIEAPSETKPVLKFEVFAQNRVNDVYLFKLANNRLNIEVYGIYTEAFSNCADIIEIARFQNLALFIKSVRIAVSKLDCDIVQCENIPYYLGCEFEKRTFSKTKVVQVVKDFTQIDVSKPETFWAAINLADKNTMKKICRDTVIKKCVANLFNLHNTGRFYKIKDCLAFIYKNYFKFRKYIDKGDDIDENVIFDRLNTRVAQLFPHISAFIDGVYYNPMMFTLKKADWIAIISKTYYKEVFDNPKLSGKMFKQLMKYKDKTSYISFGFDKTKHPIENVYYPFDVENFREIRQKNKAALLKEFSKSRIETNFVDNSLFKTEDVKIIGHLDSFYNSPLFIANLNTEVFANGMDVLFNTVLKLFELHKNIQVIISAQNGLKVNFIKSWIDFLSSNEYLNGRWVFIDGEINSDKFYAASDITLIPRRANMTTSEHYIAMNFGCVPVVARGGILNDTVSDIFEDMTTGCGFKTKTGLLCEEDANEIFLAPVLKALNIYQNNPSGWNLLIKNCLNHNSDWSFKILEAYDKIYKELV